MANTLKHRRLLGDSVRKRRKAAGLSQERLAEAAELSTVFISQVERGVKTISVDGLTRIARVLKTKVSVLTRGF